MQVLNAGLWILDSGLWALEFGRRWTLDSEHFCWLVQNKKNSVSDSDYIMQNSLIGNL